MIVVILDGKTLYENEKTLMFILKNKKYGQYFTN
jgi:hypothetical protein